MKSILSQEIHGLKISTIMFLSAFGVIVSYGYHIYKYNRYPKTENVKYAYRFNAESDCYYQALFIEDQKYLEHYKSFVSCDIKEGCKVPMSSVILSASVEVFITDTLGNEMFEVYCYYKKKSGGERFQNDLIIHKDYLYDSPLKKERLCSPIR